LFKIIINIPQIVELNLLPVHRTAVLTSLQPAGTTPILQNQGVMTEILRGLKLHLLLNLIKGMKGMKGMPLQGMESTLVVIKHRRYVILSQYLK